MHGLGGWWSDTTDYLEEMFRTGPWVSETFLHNPPVAYSDIRELTVRDPATLTPAERARLEQTVRDSQARLREYFENRTTIDDVVAWGGIALLLGAGAYLTWKAWPWLKRMA